jgi:WD40 repeat protein
MRTADGTVKILDFGLAVLADFRAADGLTAENVVLGTPDYIAPEQAENSHAADVRSDIYSLGCTMYHLLTGRVPFPGDSVLRKLDAHRTLKPEPIRNIRPEVPAELAAIVTKMIAKKPGDRFQTPAEVAAALTPFAAGTVPVRNRRRLWVAVAAALLFAGLIAAAGVVFYIKTDNGTIEIRTEDENVKILAERNGTEVKVLDPKSNQTWVVDTGKWTVRLDGNPDGLTLEMPNSFTLRRGDKQVVTVKRVKGPDPVELKPPDTIEPLHRIRWSEVRGTTISPDGRYLVADRLGGKGIRVWDSQSGKLVFERERGWVARFTQDSTQLITCETWSELHVYDLASGRQVREFDTGVQMYNFIPTASGTRLLYFTPNGGQVWDWSTGKKLCDFPWKWNEARPDETLPFIPTADGSHLLYQPDGKPPLHALDATTGKEVDAYRQLRDVPLGSFTADGKQLLCSEGRKVKVYDVATGKEVRTVEVGPDGWYAHSADGRRILTSSNLRDELRLLDTATGQLLGRLHFPEAIDTTRMTANLSRDGRSAVVSGLSDSVYVFRLPDAVKPKDEEKVGEVRRIRWEGGGRIMSTAISADSQYYLAAGDPDIARLWDLKTGQLLHEFRGYIAHFTPDGKQVLTGSESGVQFRL